MEDDRDTDKKTDGKRISLSVVRRLPRYYRYLGELLDSGIKRISSKDLSERMRVTASQIRQDLNNFGCFGQQGYGYNVELLYGAIKNLLGLDRSYSLIIVGGGSIGRSLANYKNFARRGFIFKAIFDVDPALIGGVIGGVPVYSVDEMEGYIDANHIDAAVLALPKESAPEITERLAERGIKGIWNFSHMDLTAPEGVKMENVHLTDSLMTLSYWLNSDK
ncbi:MAG: redox-sensing transcriptional repressor Rex [Clostridiales bacterium]|jgi:redox-sensing transcriptional repressor|nr:redox-sensing transcriptional repressor Rex [Clostridiales bacterium]